MYFSLLIHEGQHFRTRTVSSKESQQLPVGQFVVSSQHMACHQLSAAQTSALSEPFAPVFHQKWCLHILPLSFHKIQFQCQGLSLPVKGTTKVIFLFCFPYVSSSLGQGSPHNCSRWSPQSPFFSPSQDADQVCLFALWCCSQGSISRPAQAGEGTSLTAMPSSFPPQPGWCWADSAHKVHRRFPLWPNAQ